MFAGPRRRAVGFTKRVVTIGGEKMDREAVQTDNAPKAIGPYVQAIKANGFVYTAGQISIDPKTGNIVRGGIAEQTRQVLENLKAILTAPGSSLDRRVR